MSSQPRPPVVVVAGPTAAGKSGVAIELALPRESDVTLTVYDVAGRRVRRLFAGRVTPGEVQRALWDGRDLGAFRWASKLERAMVRKVGEAIEIYVNNRLVARGEVVVVEQRLGVTMTEIIKGDRHG